MSKVQRWYRFAIYIDGTYVYTIDAIGSTRRTVEGSILHDITKHLPFDSNGKRPHVEVVLQVVEANG